jgi:hypothetical protein
VGGIGVVFLWWAGVLLDTQNVIVRYQNVVVQLRFIVANVSADCNVYVDSPEVKEQADLGQYIVAEYCC